jgi:trans-2,3-dihydro-3-hydroxyanthranilate isomerase
VRACRYTVLDVFTATRLKGNALAVVHDADGVPDAVMHAFAREVRLSETSFLQSPTAAGADYRNRIWTMSGEIPFAGHPSLGAAAAVARIRSEPAVTYVQETGAGLQPVDVQLDDSLARVSMLQAPAEFGPELDPADVLGTLGLEADDAHPELPCQVVSTGLAHVIAPVREERALARVWPDYDRIAQVIGPRGCFVIYLVHVDAERGTARARSFAREAEMGEDPATGSAAGPLAAYVAQRTGALRLDISQGVEMGRGANLHTEIEGDRVRVGGDVVVIVDGTVFLDV